MSDPVVEVTGPVENGRRAGGRRSGRPELLDAKRGQQADASFDHQLVEDGGGDVVEQVPREQAEERGEGEPAIPTVGRKVSTRSPASRGTCRRFLRKPSFVDPGRTASSTQPTWPDRTAAANSRFWPVSGIASRPGSLPAGYRATQHRHGAAAKYRP